MKTRTRYPRLLAATLALAVLVRLPVFLAPPVLDDHAQAAMVAGTYPSPRAWWDLYAFVRGDAADHARLRDAGVLPWWAPDEFQLVMFRPLSSALVWFDQKILRHWTLARAHSLAWMLAWIAACARLLRRRAGDGVALGAAALLALDDALSTPLVWHANRCAFVALFFGALAVDAACRWLDEGRRADAARALLHAVLACLAAEYAWTLLPAAALYGRATASPRRRGVYAAVAALAVAYAVARGVAGAGVRACVLYPDLGRDLPLLLFYTPQWIVAMLGDLLVGAGVDLREPWLGVVGSRAHVALLGGALVAFAWRRADPDPARRATLRWALSSGLAAIAVVSTAWLSSRLMLAASLWGAALTAALAAWAWGDRAGRVAVIVLLAVQVPSKAVHTWRAAARYRRITAPVWDGARTLLPDDFGAGVSRGRDEAIYVLNAAGGEEIYFGRFTRQARGLPVPGRWFTFASTPTEVFLFRESPRAFSLVHPRTLLDGISARLFRSGMPWPGVGTTARVGEATLTVVAAGPAGPTRLRVEFPRDLDDPSLALYTSTASGLRVFRAPPVGTSAQLAAPPLGLNGPR